MLSATQHSHSGPPDFRGPWRQPLLHLCSSSAPLPPCHPPLLGPSPLCPRKPRVLASGLCLQCQWRRPHWGLACPLTAFSARQPGAWLLLRALGFEKCCCRPHGEHRTESLHASGLASPAVGSQQGAPGGGLGTPTQGYTQGSHRVGTEPELHVLFFPVL